jgi:hypothetical protein
MAIWRATVKVIDDDRAIVIVLRGRYIDRDACRLAAAACGSERVIGPTHYISGPLGDRWEATLYGAVRWYNAVAILRAHGYHVDVLDRRGRTRCDDSA